MDIFERLRLILEDVENPFVIECGACDGYHSEIIISIIKSKDRQFVYHGFEPNVDLHPLIQNNLRGHLMFSNGVIGIYPNAVGDVDEEVIFYKSSGQKIVKGEVADNYFGSSSILKPKIVKESFVDMRFEELKTTVVTLDSHIQNRGLAGRIIDFIYADIQGAEIKMIEGGRETFKSVRYLYTEYSNSEDYEGQGYLKDILEALPDFEIVEDYGGDILLKNIKL